MTVDVPEGFVYRPDFFDGAEEQTILQHIRAIELSEVRMRDVVARRRVAHFGLIYRYDSWHVEPGPPIPEFLGTSKDRAATLLQVGPDRLVEALITEYPPGAGIGWHRNAPVFGNVVAISLLSPCRLLLRQGSTGRASASLVIDPRSAYVLSGAVRSGWQHSISPTKMMRYSITFSHASFQQNCVEPLESWN